MEATGGLLLAAEAVAGSQDADDFLFGRMAKVAMKSCQGTLHLFAHRWAILKPNLGAHAWDSLGLRW